ncbi:hypothetical protein [Humisphaera borealis]|uniref:Uncharacterized protein n=1 Tax=Humisphaera borealis TaxID=2807512 RepID=A0A7M2WT48_9BACT|nr:hypothetical protein [Humisphaera borealis]QOV88636.1 hypothetical protein IPV69_20705 [Humisphaera borealis]
MIDPSHHDQACEALHRAIVHVRFMALNNADHVDIADALDWIELLPTLIASPDDKTSKFREALAELADRVPECRSALTIFDHATAKV